MAAILAVIALLRIRRVHPREVGVEVIQPYALRAPMPLPPAEQLLSDIAPVAEPPAPDPVLPIAAPSAERAMEVTLQPEPVRAQPTFHEPETGLQSPEVDADNVPVTQPTEEICAIGLWRGYVKSRFYAGLIGVEEEGIDYALAESQPIRLRGNGTPERTPAAERAHQALVTHLIESGWEVKPPVNGDSWYALQLHRAAAPAESNSG